METDNCRSCECKVFSPQFWKDSKCKDCFHSILDHAKDYQRHSVEKEDVANALAHEFALNVSHEQDAETKAIEHNAWRRECVVKEILSTERAYVESLTMMIAVYMKSLKAISDTIISQSQITPIFSNAEEIWPVNQQLLQDLEGKYQHWSPSQMIGDVFLKLIPFLKTYTIYTSGYSEGLAALKDAEKNSVVQAVIAKCGGSYALGLPSLLIQPVQRIPRYNLLLADLFKNTASTHPDYENLKNAAEQMLHIAENINEAIRISENRKKVLEIQESFVPHIKLVAPHRMFVRMGVLKKICRKSNKKYMFFLFSDMLIYTTQLPGDKFHLRRKFLLDDCRFESEGSAIVPFSFVIANSKKSFQVYTKTQKLQDDWLADLNQATKQSLVRKRSFKSKHDAENLDLSASAEAPVWATDDSTAACSICKDEFSFFTRRHHCRACGHVICSKCSDKKIRISSLDNKNDVRVCLSCYYKRRPKLRQSQDEASDSPLPSPAPSPTLPPAHSHGPPSSPDVCSTSTPITELKLSSSQVEQRRSPRPTRSYTVLAADQYRI